MRTVRRYNVRTAYRGRSHVQIDLFGEHAEDYLNSSRLAAAYEIQLHTSYPDELSAGYVFTDISHLELIRHSPNGELEDFALEFMCAETATTEGDPMPQRPVLTNEEGLALAAAALNETVIGIVQPDPNHIDMGLMSVPRLPGNGGEVIAKCLFQARDLLIQHYGTACGAARAANQTRQKIKLTFDFPVEASDGCEIFARIGYASSYSDDQSTRLNLHPELLMTDRAAARRNPPRTEAEQIAAERAVEQAPPDPNAGPRLTVRAQRGRTAGRVAEPLPGNADLERELARRPGGVVAGSDIADAVAGAMGAAQTEDRTLAETLGGENRDSTGIPQ